MKAFIGLFFIASLCFCSFSVTAAEKPHNQSLPADPNSVYYRCLKEQTGMEKPDKNDINANVHYEVARRKAREYCYKCCGLRPAPSQQKHSDKQSINIDAGYPRPTTEHNRMSD